MSFMWNRPKIILRIKFEQKKKLTKNEGNRNDITTIQNAVKYENSCRTIGRGKPRHSSPSSFVEKISNQVINDVSVAQREQIVS